MNDKEITIPITPEIPKRKKEMWYLLIFEKKDGENLSSLLMEQLRNIPFILGSNIAPIWLRNVDFLIIPEDALTREETVLRTNGIRHFDPIKIEIRSIPRNILENVANDFYVNFQVEEKKLVDFINELKQKKAMTHTRGEARKLRDDSRKIIECCERITERDVCRIVELSENIEKEISELRAFLKNPLPVL